VNGRVRRVVFAAGTNEHFGVVVESDAVNLPEVEAIGLQALQGLFQHLHGERSVATVSADFGQAH
jgi:hypothetical protein